jgi:hypothetical protein
MLELILIYFLGFISLPTFYWVSVALHGVYYTLNRKD